MRTMVSLPSEPEPAKKTWLKCGGEISAIIPDGAALVEFGAGATTKVRLLLNQCAFGAYVPVDISGDFLNAQAATLRAARFAGAARLRRCAALAALCRAAAAAFTSAARCCAARAARCRGVVAVAATCPHSAGDAQSQN